MGCVLSMGRGCHGVACLASRFKMSPNLATRRKQKLSHQDEPQQRLLTISRERRNVHEATYEVKLVVKPWTTSFNRFSKSLLSAPSLSIVARRSDSLLLRWARKSASHVKILATGTLSK